VLQLGDFDGDGEADAAVFVRQLATGKRGIVLVRRAERRPIILGAGTAVERIGDDLRWLDIWRVEPGKHGDRLLVEKSETATGALIWDGRRFWPDAARGLGRRLTSACSWRSSRLKEELELCALGGVAAADARSVKPTNEGLGKHGFRGAHCAIARGDPGPGWRKGSSG
jgi:hypothetical protein